MSLTQSEWIALTLQVLANVALLGTAAIKLGARLAVIETKIKYIERELSIHASTR